MDSPQKVDLSILAPVCDVNLKLWDGVVVRERCGWYGDFTHVVSAEEDFYQKPPNFWVCGCRSEEERDDLILTSFWRGKTFHLEENGKF